jgi:hypothetical protein
MASSAQDDGRGHGEADVAREHEEDPRAGEFLRSQVLEDPDAHRLLRPNLLQALGADSGGEAAQPEEQAQQRHRADRDPAREQNAKQHRHGVPCLRSRGYGLVS